MPQFVYIAITALFIVVSIVSQAMPPPQFGNNVSVNNIGRIGTSEQPTIDGGVIKNSIKDNNNYDQSTTRYIKQLLTTAAHNDHDNYNGKLAYVLKKINEKGLPADVAILPLVESHYRNTAVSPKGTAGIWQLMPQTARQYGLAKDERYQIMSATEAALNLLHDLYQQFNNWELAFAAYNAGTSRVQAALRKKPDATTVQELDLPLETKNYVARIIALNQVMKEIAHHEKN